MAPTLFNPSPSLAAAVIADLNDCSLSFDALAAKHGTTSESLALWLSTTQVKDRVHLTLDAMSLRIRVIAASRLPAALRAITELVESTPVLSSRDLDPGGTCENGAPGTSANSGRPDTLRDLEFRRRHNESIRRACTVLLRLANFFSPTSPPAPRASLSRQPGEVPRPPRGGEGPLSRSPGEVPPFVGGGEGIPSPPSTSPLPPRAASQDPRPEIDLRSAFNAPASPIACAPAARRPELIAAALASLLHDASANRAAAEPASDTPGINPPAHPEEVHAPDHQFNTTESTEAAHAHPVPLSNSTSHSAVSDFSSSSQSLAPAASAHADPRPPPGSYQRPRRRFKVRR